jgi:hypothetical protein
MKNILFFLLVSFSVVGAWAQPPASREPTTTEPSAAEQRRAELRAALKAQRARDAQDRKDQSLEVAPAFRHLSDQERADLRQQLRPPHRDARPERQ